MNDFFKPPPPKARLEELPQAAWMGPPRNGVPAVLPVERVILRTEEVGIYLSCFWGSWHYTFWVWPLPPPGSFDFVCEWPVAEMPITRFELDADLLLEAASRSRDRFPSS